MSGCCHWMLLQRASQRPGIVAAPLPLTRQRRWTRPPRSRARTLASWPYLFAEMRGVGGLDEAQLITFAHEFLRAVSALISRGHTSRLPAIPGETDCSSPSSRLPMRACSPSIWPISSPTRSGASSLPGDFEPANGLHAGPVHEYFDPVSEQTTFCGVHVTHGAGGLNRSRRPARSTPARRSRRSPARRTSATSRASAWKRGALGQGFWSAIHVPCAAPPADVNERVGEGEHNRLCWLLDSAPLAGHRPERPFCRIRKPPANWSVAARLRLS